MIRGTELQDPLLAVGAAATQKVEAAARRGRVVRLGRRRGHVRDQRLQSGVAREFGHVVQGGRQIPRQLQNLQAIRQNHERVAVHHLQVLFLGRVGAITIELFRVLHT